MPDNLIAKVAYGDNVKSMAAYLYREGVVSIDRIGDFINSLSGDTLCVSAGAIYGFCHAFSEACATLRPSFGTALLHSHEICTDATPVTMDGRQIYIRNCSTSEYVLYYASEKKNLWALGAIPVLDSFTGTLTHDHETALYHFGTSHGECNVHIAHYLQKNTEETGNTWSYQMKKWSVVFARTRVAKCIATS